MIVYSPLDLLALQLRVGHLDDTEKVLFDILAEHAAGHLPQKLLQHAGDRVNAKIVHVDQATCLQEVRQLLHGALVAGGSEHVLAAGRFLVQLQNQHLHNKQRQSQPNKKKNLVLLLHIIN